MLNSGEIRNDIWYCENEIWSLDCELRCLRSDIEDCNALKEKMTSLRDRFYFRQAERRSRLKVVASLSNVKLASTYSSSMNELLTGTDYHTACHTIEKTQADIQLKIQELEELVSEKKRRRHNLEVWQENLYDMLYVAMSEENSW